MNDDPLDTIDYETFQQLPLHAIEIGALFLPNGLQNQKETCCPGERVFLLERQSQSTSKLIMRKLTDIKEI